MARTVSSMGRASIQALFGNNTNEAYRVIETDDEVDQDEVRIENLCIGVIAPAAFRAARDELQKRIGQLKDAPRS